MVHRRYDILKGIAPASAAKPKKRAGAAAAAATAEAAAELATAAATVEAAAEQLAAGVGLRGGCFAWVLILPLGRGRDHLLLGGWASGNREVYR